MRKIKIAYLLLGIGVGIVLVNGLYYLFPKVKYVDLSDEMIIERAKELGYVSFKESIIKEKESEKNIGNKEKNLEVIDGEDKKFTKIEILEGDTLSHIAEKLFKAELIDNKEEFILLAEDKMVDKKFAYGVFEIKYNTSYSTIIKLLTK